jgi:hypothetical protein
LPNRSARRSKPSPAPAYITETADSIFGNKEMMPLSAFTKKMGLDRDTILRLVADNLLDVYQYSPGKYRKILVSKSSFIRFLKTTSLRKLS